MAMSASNTGVIRVRVRMSILYVAYDCTCKYNLITVRPYVADQDLNPIDRLSVDRMPSLGSVGLNLYYL